MDLLATRARRRLLFAALYLSEGAPIGFLWLTLPTRLRAGGVELERITTLTALLVIPWTFKFGWAPLIDILRTPRWTLRHWIVSAQAGMALTLVPLLWLDLKADFGVITGLLLLHALAAATQDVAIDALCISVTDPTERGRLNGWMQAGMLLGRALMGGGALVIAAQLGDEAVVLLLLAIILTPLLLLLPARLPRAARSHRGTLLDRAREVGRESWLALGQRRTWLGLGFAFVGGAAFKSLEVVLGPFLIDRGYSKVEIGWFSAGPMILCMILGSLAGGWLADRVERRRFVAATLGFFVVAIAALALLDHFAGETRGRHLLVCLALSAIGIGLFTAASYALFMDLTAPRIAATQFSAFMGATNGCESWSSYAVGQIAGSSGYPTALLVLCGASLLALPLLRRMHPRTP